MVEFDRNADGSVIVKLSEPIKVGNEEFSRLTIPALRGRHMRLCPFKAGDVDVPMGLLVEFAALIVQPAGAVDELDPLESLAVGAEVAALMGKGRATGGGH